jgi:hypothetical protein
VKDLLPLSAVLSRSKLRDLSLIDNGLNSKGLLALVKVLPSCSSLFFLELCNNSFTKEAKEAFHSVVPRTSLCYYDIDSTRKIYASIYHERNGLREGYGDWQENDETVYRHEDPEIIPTEEEEEKAEVDDDDQ